MSRRALLMLTALVACGLSAAGCKAKQPSTPEAVAQAFADAMAAGDTEAAAELWDFETEARHSNPDWGEIPSGQRAQIVTKLRSQMAGELKAQMGSFSKGTKAGTPTLSGTTAAVQLDGGPQGPIAVQLTQSDGRWRVTTIGPAPGG